MKQAVISYQHSDNLGDYIQTLAAEQYLSGDMTRFDRDTLHIEPENEYKLLINGWFMEKPKNWPPHPKFKPLFLSFHLNPTAEKQMLNPEGVAYLKKHQPIGCRDKHTLRRLQSHGIEAYFTACLTLGLSLPTASSKQTKKAPILVVSAFERLATMGKALDSKSKGVFQQLKAGYNRYRYKKAQQRLNTFLSRIENEVVYKSQIVTAKNTTSETLFQLAQSQLEAIAVARLVITSRIHTALPAVALGIPVVFLTDGLEHPNQKSRLEGMTSFFTCINSKELKSLQWEQLEATENHRPFVEKMQSEISTFFKDKAD